MNAFSPTSIFTPPLPHHSKKLDWNNLCGASIGLALTSAIKNSAHPILIIAPDNLSIAHLMEELSFFGDHTEELIHFPDWETLPYDHFSPHQDIISERLTALYQIPQMQKGAVITSIATLMHRLPPRNYLDGQSFLLKIGDKLNIDHLRTRLSNAGYHHVNQVREHGEYTIRGSIIDLYPMGGRSPYRIDLFDDEVDSIRLFSAETQRSTEKIAEIRLLPAKEFPLTEEAIEHFRQSFRSQFGGNPLKCPIYQDISEGICSPGIEYYLPLFFEKTVSLFDYLPANTLIAFIGNYQTKANEFWQECTTRYHQGRFDISRPLLTPQQLFITAEMVASCIKEHPILRINFPHETNSTKQENAVSFATTSIPNL
ncbi:MAG: transcription-repair coupling factor, partial [Gammaproteobacteria bacterium]|nr:transcription-repair coupling factor [Gammaproteobacteria bacterium]